MFGGGKQRAISKYASAVKDCRGILFFFNYLATP